MIDKSKKMQSEELENVYGGKDCYAKGVLTYERLKIIPHPTQKITNHPLVVVDRHQNKCDGFVKDPNPDKDSNSRCYGCMYCVVAGLDYDSFCKLRSKELDPFHREY